MSSSKKFHTRSINAYVWLKRDIENMDFLAIGGCLNDEVKTLPSNDNRNESHIYVENGLWIGFRDATNHRDCMYFKIDLEFVDGIATKSGNQRCKISAKWAGDYYGGLCDFRYKLIFETIDAFGIMVWNLRSTSDTNQRELQEKSYQYKFERPIDVRDLHSTAIKIKEELAKRDESHAKTIVKITAFYGCKDELRIRIAKNGNVHSSALRCLSIRLKTASLYQSEISVTSEERTVAATAFPIVTGDTALPSTVIGEKLTLHGEEWKNWKQEVDIIAIFLESIGIVGN